MLRYLANRSVSLQIDAAEFRLEFITRRLLARGPPTLGTILASCVAIWFRDLLRMFRHAHIFIKNYF